MIPTRRFSLVYAPEVRQHLKSIERKYHALIRSEIEKGLCFEPDLETRNRRPLLRPVTFEAEWELRFGPGDRFRAFYEVDREQGRVHVLAVGVKNRHRLRIGGEEVQL